ncbi:MAG: hypothetical protein MSG64_08610 [Pyrinomonadaceae bacterium MAG19_C2-C3]|nr:hypothetical protein [Pyrinomonadaceae bacterium MAG19_C2-C3]
MREFARFDLKNRFAARERPASAQGSSIAPVQWFLLFQFACQLILIFTDIGTLRPLLRIASFGASLALLIFIQGCGRRHPASSAAVLILIIAFISILHPTTNSLIGGAAQAALYLAIIAPLFWVSRLEVNLDGLRRVVLIIWLFNTAGAGVGVLQVVFPGRFQPNLSSVVQGVGKGYVDSLMITTPDGARTFRPMGLTDIPGGASSAGFYAILFSVAFLLTRTSPPLKVLCGVSIFLGVACLYLAQVRSTVVLAGISMTVFAGLLASRLRLAKMTALATILGAVIVVGFAYSAVVVGDKFESRLTTLTAESPGSVYFKNRGMFLQQTIDELLPQYPFGAGLARWGMMNYYFGQKSDADREPIYVEIQWTGWLLDGGVPLILAYCAAIFIATLTAYRIVHRTFDTESDELIIWGALVVGYNVAMFALTFSYTPFIGQAGIEFWILNALIFAAANYYTSDRQNRTAMFQG